MDEDLIQRLRAYPVNLSIEAADRIEALEAEVERQKTVIGNLNATIDHLGMKGRDSKTRDTALLRQALEALELSAWHDMPTADEHQADVAIAALRERLGERSP